MDTNQTNNSQGKNRIGGGITALIILLLLLTLLASSILARYIAANTVKSLTRDGSAITISGADISDDGDLVLSFSDGSTINAGPILDQSWYEKTIISNAQVNDKGELLLTTTEGKTINAGVVIDKEWMKNVEQVLANMPQGAQGATGAQGPAGAQGEAGAQGVGISNIALNDKGEMILSLTDGRTLNIGLVKGEQGLQGIQGIQGIQGAQGIQGIQGETGATGAAGADGAAGQSAYEIAVANGFSGTQAEWLASLKGEKGDTGEAGATGATGATGETGATGAAGAAGAAGQSAYEIAVANGFSGTQAEWLASLKGEKGDTGATGATGAQGEKGDKGDKGDPGELATSDNSGLVVEKAEINGDGNLEVTYTNGSTETFVLVTGSAGANIVKQVQDGDLIYSLLAGGQIAVSAAKNFSRDSITIPDTVPTSVKDAELSGQPITQILTDGFANKTTLKTVVISSSIDRIGARAFYGSGITSVTLPSANTWTVTGKSFSYTYISIYQVDDGQGDYHYEREDLTRTYSISSASNAANALKGGVSLLTTGVPGTGGATIFQGYGAGTYYNTYTTFTWYDSEWYR